MDLPVLPPTSGPGPVDRRRFLAEATRLAALAALVGACSDSLTAPALDGPVTVTLADYPELAAVGGVARVREVAAPVALVRLGAQEWAALSLVCPHAGTTVRVTGAAFTCPNHGARFALDGGWTGGERTSSLRSFPTAWDAAAGTVTIRPAG